MAEFHSYPPHGRGHRVLTLPSSPGTCTQAGRPNAAAQWGGTRGGNALGLPSSMASLSFTGSPQAHPITARELLAFECGNMIQRGQADVPRIYASMYVRRGRGGEGGNV